MVLPIFINYYGESHPETQKVIKLINCINTEVKLIEDVKLTEDKFRAKDLLDRFKTDQPITFTYPTLDKLKLEQILMKYKASNDTQLPSIVVAFRRAAAMGSKEDVKFLYRAVKDINVQDDNPKNKKTALHWAAIWKHRDIFDFLISKGAKANIKDADGKTAKDYGKVAFPHLRI